jgi:two-component system, OmpR family, sensor histidine kinase VanS
MRKSIRIKLFSYMLAVIIVFALLLFVFNTFFAEKYYIYHKKNALITASNELEVYLSKYIVTEEETDYKTVLQDEELIKTINGIEKKLGGTIVIGKEKEEIYYPIANGPKGMPAGLIHNENRKPPGEKTGGSKEKGSPSPFIITKDPDYDINTLRYQIQKEDGLIIVIWVPMAEISENAALSNSFTMIIGLLTILLTAGFTLLISDKFTKPIKEMNEITARMSKLDFTNKLHIRSNDELGELSESINELSCSLNTAIDSLNEMNSKLSQDIDYERQFLANVSHELKTPVFLIQGYAEGLKVDIAKNQLRRDFYCDVIMEEAEKMDALIKELLDLSRLKQGGFVIEKEEFNISKLLCSLMDKYKEIFGEKGFQLETDLTDHIIVYADKIRTEQVMTNYIINAVHHGEAGKSICISLRNQENKAVFSIYNSSPPIPEEELEKLWQSFYKLNRARTREDKGTGLGLSIVRAIQEAQGFSYGVQNQREGVVFWCDFLKV